MYTTKYNWNQNIDGTQGSLGLRTPYGLRVTGYGLCSAYVLSCLVFVPSEDRLMFQLCSVYVPCMFIVQSIFHLQIFWCFVYVPVSIGVCIDISYRSKYIIWRCWWWWWWWWWWRWWWWCWWRWWWWCRHILLCYVHASGFFFIQTEKLQI